MKNIAIALPALSIAPFVFVFACQNTPPPATSDSAASNATSSAATNATAAADTTAMSSTTAAPPATASSAPATTAAAPSTDGDTNDPLVGKLAPDFTSRTHDGKTIHLAALKGKPVVVYFYPADETPGCTKEACSFRDAWKELSATGAVMIGISTDNEESHKKFATHWKLPFQLVSDPKGEIAGKFGVPVQDKYIARQTFVIGADGNVKKVYRKVDVGAHAQQVMADLKGAS